MAPEVLEAAQEFTSSAFKQIDVYATALVGHFLQLPFNIHLILGALGNSIPN